MLNYIMSECHYSIYLDNVVDGLRNLNNLTLKHCIVTSI